MIKKPSKHDLSILTSYAFGHISNNCKDEMAIPSYLHKNPLIRWLMWKRYEYIAELSKFNKNMSVLEFGCGAGVFLPELSKSCGRVFAIDIFTEYARLLSEKLDLDVSFINSLSEIPDGTLDIIIAADVLEHVADPEEYLVQFHKKLKNKGRLIISGPTENTVYRIGRMIAGFMGKQGYHHTNINDLIGRIREAGYSPAGLKTLPFVFPPYLFKVCEFKKA